MRNYIHRLSDLLYRNSLLGLLITDPSMMPGMTASNSSSGSERRPFRGKIMMLSAHLSAENRAAYEALAVDAMVSNEIGVAGSSAETKSMGQAA